MHTSKKISGNSFIEFYDLDNSILHANWCGYLTVDQVKEGCEKMLELTANHSFKYVLNDNTHFKGSFTQALGWLGKDFMPRLVAEGVLKIAFVYSKDEAAKYSVNRLLEENDEYEGQAFDDFQESYIWIKELSNINFKNLYLTIPSKSDIDTDIVYNEILYITSMGNSIMIYTKKKTYESNLTLKKIIELLPQPQFFRVHKSYIVNIHCVNNIKYHAGGTYRLNIVGLGNVFIPVGRVYAPDLKLTLKNVF